MSTEPQLSVSDQLANLQIQRRQPYKAEVLAIGNCARLYALGGFCSLENGSGQLLTQMKVWYALLGCARPITCSAVGDMKTVQLVPTVQ